MPREESTARRPGPPWPTATETPAPRGYHWETVHHQTVHVRLLVPDGITPKLTQDAYGYPAVEIDVAGQVLRCQFDSGIGALGATLAKRPPTVYKMAVERSQLTADNAAVRYRDSLGQPRISGFAPGVACNYEGLVAPPDADLDALYTVCASVHSPAPGPWRPASAAERANGGMTDVPDGAWVESELPRSPGSILRPGRFVAHMYLGELVIRSAPCPSLDDLRKVEAPASDVQLERRQRALGDIWIRRTTETYDGYHYPGTTMVLSPHGSRCCVADLRPWTHPSDPQKVDYAIALCDTFREH